MPYVIKYRPKTFDDVIGQETIIERLKNCVSKGIGGFPTHLLFEGPPGSGKTSCAEVVARELFKDGFSGSFKELNASDDRGIKVVRERIKKYARIGRKKIIFLTEADQMCLPKGTEIIVGRTDSKEGLRTQVIEKIVKNRYVFIPSVNLETGKIENDKGKCLVTGQADFYRLTLEDNRFVVASYDHPLFILQSNKLIRIELNKLKVGDEIVDYSDQVFIGQNNSDDAKIDPVKIISIEFVGRQEAWNITMERNPSFILGNGILTHNTSDAQHALRRVMEMYQKQTIFILDCNYVHRIIDPIRSRCASFHFKPLDNMSILQKILSILANEGVNFDSKNVEFRKAILTLVEMVRGDLRAALNNVETLVTKDLEINYKNIISVQPTDEPKAIFYQAFMGNIEQAIKSLEVYLIQNNNRWEKIFESWYRIVKNMPSEDEDEEIRARKKAIGYRIMHEMATSEDRCRRGNVPLYQISGLLAFIWRAPNLVEG